MILSKVLSIRNTFIKSKLKDMIKQVWNISPLAPHLLPTFPHFHASLFLRYFSYIVDIQWLKFLSVVLARPLHYINRTTNELNGSGRVH